MVPVNSISRMNQSQFTLTISKLGFAQGSTTPQKHLFRFAISNDFLGKIARVL
jgi:hypothetical protein